MRPKMVQPISMPANLTPYQRFERLAKGLFAVPKEELHQVEKREMKKRERARKSKAK